MKLLFGILSSRNTSEAIQQICTAVGERNEVLVHHDFGQQPDFHLDARNATVIKEYLNTDWGGWGFTQAILKIMGLAHQKFEFDYFQLLSDSCLPIKPIAQFEEYLEREQPDATFEAYPISTDDVLTLLNYGYCYYSRNRLEKTVMRRLARLVLMPADRKIPRLERGGLALDRLRPPNALTQTASYLHKSLVKRAENALPLGGGCIYCGSSFFGISRHVLARVLAEYSESPELMSHFRRRGQIVDEGLFPTLIMKAKPNKVLGFNHFVRWTQRRTGPDELGVSDIDQLRKSNKFFARKFPKDPNSEVRRLILSELSG